MYNIKGETREFVFLTNIEKPALFGRWSYYYERKEVKCKMAEINLSKYGITGTTEIVYNPSYEMLFEEETKARSGRI